jgi:hypothetical protein
MFNKICDDKLPQLLFYYMYADVRLKLPATDIIQDILFRLGVKEAEFSNKLEENDMFRGICKITLNGVVNSKASGPTIIEGDVKRTAQEAECSAAANAINFSERCIGFEIMDVNLTTFKGKHELLRGLQCVRKKHIVIENEISAEW